MSAISSAEGWCRPSQTKASSRSHATRSASAGSNWPGRRWPATYTPQSTTALPPSCRAPAWESPSVELPRKRFIAPANARDNGRVREPGSLISTSPGKKKGGRRQATWPTGRGESEPGRPRPDGSGADLLDRGGEPAHALLDLVGGDRREGQPHRAAAAVEQEVGALDDGHALLHRGREQLVDVHVGGQVDPEEVAAVRLGEGRAGDVLAQRLGQHLGPLAERGADRGDRAVDVAGDAELVHD